MVISIEYYNSNKLDFVFFERRLVHDHNGKVSPFLGVVGYISPNDYCYCLRQRVNRFATIFLSLKILASITNIILIIILFPPGKGRIVLDKSAKKELFRKKYL
jgi:hypothetical protein